MVRLKWGCSVCPQHTCPFSHIILMGNCSVAKWFSVWDPPGQAISASPRNWQRMRRSDSITDSTAMNLSKLWELAKDRSLAGCRPWGRTSWTQLSNWRVGHNLATEQQDLVSDANSQVPLQTYLSKSSGGWGPAIGVLTSPPGNSDRAKVWSLVNNNFQGN